MKGQTGIETLFIIGAIFLLVLALQLIFISPRSNEAQNALLYLSAKDVCGEAASAINIASFSGSGFYLKLNLPAKLTGFRNYTLTVYSTSIIVAWNQTEQEEVICRISAKNVTLTNMSIPVPFVLNRTQYTVRNTNGAISIE